MVLRCGRAWIQHLGVESNDRQRAGSKTPLHCVITELPVSCLPHFDQVLSFRVASVFKYFSISVWRVSAGSGSLDGVRAHTLGWPSNSYAQLLIAVSRTPRKRIRPLDFLIIGVWLAPFLPRKTQSSSHKEPHVYSRKQKLDCRIRSGHLHKSTERHVKFVLMNDGHGH